MYSRIPATTTVVSQPPIPTDRRLRPCVDPSSATTGCVCG